MSVIMSDEVGLTAENIGLVIQVPSSSCNVGSSNISIMDTSDIDIKEEKKFTFKDPNFQHSRSVSRKKTYKTLKQIVAQEKSLPWPPNAVTYSSISAPPSLLPPKKYSDMSGLPAKYTDPQTKLYYAAADEFSTIRNLPSDIISGYLTLRGANNPIG